MSLIGTDLDLGRIEVICSRYGVGRLDVFGSTSRGEADGDSDLDLLYELLPGARLGWHIEDLADELSEAMGRPVDLVSRTALHAQLRDAVLAQARLLYAT